MYPLDLPQFDYRIKSSGQVHYIFDIIRKRYVRLTPEEWTRQHFLHYLIHHLGYPKSLLSIERGISFHERQHRPDIVAYDRAGKALMLVECKAAHVALDEAAYQQLARYNSYFQAKLLVVTNGQQHGCWHCQEGGGVYTFLYTIPAFDSLI